MQIVKQLLISISLMVVACLSGSVAHAESVKCKRTVAKATAVFTRAQSAILQRCVQDRLKFGDPPTGSLAACKADSKVAAKLTRATTALTKAIGAACGGKDKLCGGDLTGEDLPATIGWPTRCPNLENGACSNLIFTCGDITTCVQCIGQAAVEQIVSTDYEAFLNQTPGSPESGCQIGVTKAVKNYINAKSGALQRCWDKVLAGKPGYVAPCPSGDPTGKTQKAIDKAELTQLRSICKACGGTGDKNQDGLCDSVGFDPQSSIGFGLTCPNLQAPSGHGLVPPAVTDCAAIGSIDSLQKYADCVGCLADFKVDCSHRNGVLASSAYPPECNPGHSLTLYGDLSIGKNLQVSTWGALSLPAPAGNLEVTISSADPGKVLLSTTPDGAGSPSIVVQVSAGSASIPTFYVHGLDSSGAVTITASAPLYSSDSAVVTLSPSGFTFAGALYGNPCYYGYCGADFSTFTNALDSALGTQSVRLDAGLNPVERQALRPGAGPVNVAITSATPATGTIVGSPVLFPDGGSVDASAAFHPVAAGSSLLSITTPAGFDTPSSGTAITATVTQPYLYFGGDVTVGEDLLSYTYLYLAASPSAPVDVTVTVANPAVARISTDPSVVGGTTITFSNVTSTYVGPVYVHGIDRTAGPTTTLLAQSSGYTDGNATVTVEASGFVFAGALYGNPCWYGYCGADFSTYSNAVDSLLGVQSVRLDAGLNAVERQALRPGVGPVNVVVGSSTPATGTIVGSPAVFADGDSLNTSVAFHPLSLGSTSLSISTPSGFDTPSSGVAISATVIQPSMYFSGDAAVGEDLLTYTYLYLSATPNSPISVTVTVADPAVATISDDPSAMGGNTVTFTNVTSTYVGAVYVHGINRTAGPSTTLVAQSSGYADGGATVTVDRSGFSFTGSVFGNPCWYGYCGADFSTNSNSADSPLGIQAVRLDASLTPVERQSVRPGAGPVNVVVSSGTPSAGTIVASPAIFSDGGSLQTSTSFHPVAPGTTLLSLTTPAGFDTPTSYTAITATVTVPPSPAMSFSTSSLRVGRNLQVPVTLYLTPAPSPSVNVTITSSNGSAVTLVDTAGRTTAGSGTLNLNGVSTPSVTVYVQGRQAALSAVTLTASASGYTDATTSVLVDEAGFVFASSGFTTSAGAGTTSLTVIPVLLDATYLNVLGYYGQEVRGGLSNVQVPVSSSNPSVGTITATPPTYAVFNAGDASNSNSVAFQPAGAGTTTLSVGAPSGFSPPSNGNVSIVATVLP